MLRVDTKVSEVGLGTAQIGSRIWSWGRGYNKKTILAAYEKAFELGLNFIDTAESYANGVSEEIVSEIMRGRRDDVFLATKVSPGHLHYDDLLRACEGSLRRLRTDVIDLYQIHAPSSFVPLKESMRAMNHLLSEGKIRYAGVSNFLVPYVREARSLLARGELVSNQVKYNLLQREVEEELIPYCRREGLTVIAYSPHAQGLLTGKYDAEHRPTDEIRSTMMSYFTEENMKRVQPVIRKLEEVARKRRKTPGQVALNWTLRDETVYPIVGVKRASQVVQCHGAMGWRLTDEEWKGLARTAEGVKIEYLPSDS